MNPLYKQYGKNNNPMEMIQRFMQFKNSFQGNPQQEVQKIISSGNFTQEQINQFQQMATSFQGILNGMGKK